MKMTIDFLNLLNKHPSPPFSSFWLAVSLYYRFCHYWPSVKVLCRYARYHIVVGDKCYFTFLYFNVVCFHVCWLSWHGRCWPLSSVCLVLSYVSCTHACMHAESCMGGMWHFSCLVCMLYVVVVYLQLYNVCDVYIWHTHIFLHLPFLG